MTARLTALLRVALAPTAHLPVWSPPSALADERHPALVRRFDLPVVTAEARRAGLATLLPAMIDGEDTARLFWARYPDPPRQESRLPAAHRRIVGRPMAERVGGVHDAADDVRGCAALFFALRRAAAARPAGA